MTESSSLSGIIVIDKPAGLTSAAAVERVKRLLPRGTKIGHAGTLDPFATGVLVLLVGQATKLCETMMNQHKTYEATVKLGATTPTDDLESAEMATACSRPVCRSDIDATLLLFQGSIDQRPPAYSAIKVGGRRAYDLARQGRQITLEARPVQIYRIEVLRFEYPLLDLVIECGRGTYVRSVGRDLGEQLGVGGYLTRLRRTRVGAYTVDQALALDALQPQSIDQLLQPAPAQDKAHR